MQSSYWKPLVTALLLALLSVPASAQYYGGEFNDGNDTLRKRIYNELEQDRGRLLMRFWEPRLNAYKERIDNIFSSGDLLELNELRVRFAIMMEQRQKMMEEYRKKYEQTDYATTDTTVMAVAEAAAIDSVIAVSEEASDEATTMTEAEAEEYEAVNQEEVARLEEERAQKYEAEREAEQEREMEAREAELASGEYIDIENRYREEMELVSVSKWLARGYRSELDNLADQILADLVVFADTLDNFTQQFTLAHNQDLARVPDMRRHIASDMDAREFRSLARYPLSFKFGYQKMIESFVLLYNGDGVAKLLGSFPDNAPIEVNGLPENSMLQQNSPNPASGTTVITYTLPEASTETTLRIYNAQGEVVVELEEGAQSAGVHEAKVDVADLPSGSYLYQLTARLSQGPQVSSMVMQVAK
jgi:hypothetical protein